MAKAMANAPRIAGWTLRYGGFDPEQEGLREALCSLGNGRFASRGAAPEAVGGEVHYPGTYAAGCFNRLTSDVGGRDVEDEALVNLPNWLPLTFRIDDGEWFGLGGVELLDYAQVLDIKRAVLIRMIRCRDREDRETALTQRRFMSMATPQVAALETTVASINWAGRLTLRSALDGRVTNSGVERYRALANRHLTDVETGVVDDETIVLEARTSNSRITVAEAARTRLLRDGEPAVAVSRAAAEDAWIGLELDVELEPGGRATAEKIVALYTSREPALSEPGLQARRTVGAAPGFDQLLAEHVRRWSELWDLCSLELSDDTDYPSAALRLHTYHLLITVSEHTREVDAGVPARGLTGEAYRGHIFWDTLFIFPFLNLRLPEVTRALIRYRYRRLNAARRAAREAGFEGALYPWQSGASGEELTPTVHLNPRSGRWLPDNSRLQRHINVEIAYNVWLHQQATDDVEFLAFYGAEMFVEVARFWASLATYSEEKGRYEIRGVVGPDEYHDGYPDADRPGVDNNAYTNAMAAWVLWRAPQVLEMLPGQRRDELSRLLGLRREELERWDEISRRMLIPFHDGDIISQFEGYGELEELDWDAYRERYGNIHRLDRILEAEGDTANRYKASKQADVLMLFYLLSADELGELFERLSYPLEREAIPRNIAYYEARTSHGSTLSKVVHAWVLARSDRERSWELFTEALDSDIADVQGGTTPEGVHLGAMAGTVDLVQRGFSGLETRDEVLWLNPTLPQGLSELRFKLRYRRHWGLEVLITTDHLTVTAPPSDEPPIRVGLDGDVVELRAGHSVERRVSRT
jgi:alpha,alpha-trehalase